jgi:glutamate racemase
MVINPAGAVASQTESVLAKMNVLSRKSNKPERVFLTTGNSRQASEKAQALLKQSIMFTSCNL